MKNVIKKLKEIRQNKGLSGEQVALALGKSGNYFISRIESGETKLNLDTLGKLCNLYEITPSSLFSEDPPVKRRKGFFDRVSFRGETSLTEDLKSQIEPYLSDLRKIGRLQKYLDYKVFDHTKIFQGEIDESQSIQAKRKIAKEAAIKLRKYFNLRDDQNIDIANFITEQLNIPVIGLELNDKTWGIYSKDIFQNPLIIFSKSHTYEGRKKFSIAHELGHFIFHNDLLEIDTTDGNKASNDNEKVAHAFAQELLVPSAEFRRIFDEFNLSQVKKINPYHVVILANHFKVSFKMITYVLKDLNKISSEDYKTLDDYCQTKLNQDSDSIGYSPKDYFIEPPPLKLRVKNLAIEAKVKKLIGSDEFSKITGISNTELDGKFK